MLTAWDSSVVGESQAFFCVWGKRAACIGTMQNKWGFGTSKQAFCNAKVAVGYTTALLT